VKHWIADVSQVREATSPEDQTWIAEQAPRFIEAGLQSIITVLPQSALAKLSTKGWQRQLAGADTGFSMVDVGSAEEAAAAIAQLNKRVA